jgi:hypothetical protein
LLYCIDKSQPAIVYVCNQPIPFSFHSFYLSNQRDFLQFGDGTLAVLGIDRSQNIPNNGKTSQGNLLKRGITSLREVAAIEKGKLTRVRAMFPYDFFEFEAEAELDKKVLHVNSIWDMGC